MRSLHIVAWSLTLASACRGGEHSEPKLVFPSRVAPPLRADGIEDVVVSRADCRGTEAELRNTWGAPRNAGAGVLRWSDRDTKWIADLSHKGSGCQLVFTTARYFGVLGHAPRGLAAIRTGTTKEEVRRIAPALADAQVAIDLPGITGATHAITFDRTSNRVEDLYLILPSRAVEGLVMAWGPGPTWIDPSTSTASRLEPLALESSILRFHHYMPFEQWLGGGTSIAVLPNDIWTLDFSAFAKAHPELHPDIERPYTLTLPATESSPFGGVIAAVDLENAKFVEKVSFAFPYKTPAMRDRTIALLERKWGPRKQTDGLWTFERADGVSAIDQLGQIVVYITRRR